MLAYLVGISFAKYHAQVIGLARNGVFRLGTREFLMKKALTIVASIALLIWASLRYPVLASELPAGSGSAEQMATAAEAFLSSLDRAQREIVNFDLEHDDRATWSNLPTLMAPPSGLLISEMTTAQRRLLHELLRTSLSSQGYLKAAGITLLDDILRQDAFADLRADKSGPNDPWDAAMAENRSAHYYAVAFFGAPVNDDWGWKMTGHHLAVNFTVADGRVGFTPMFIGSNPRVVLEGRYAGFAALGHESERGIDLMRSLTPDQQETALIHETVADDVFEGPGRRGSLRDYEGLKASMLSVGQMRLLQTLVSEFVRNAEFDAAERQMAAIEKAGWENLYFSWRGEVRRDSQFYYRVHGPRILIEYNRQDPNHDHAVVRDPQNDYGEDWLSHHYKEFHQTVESAERDARRRLGID